MGGALELHGVQLFLFDLDVLSFREFVAPALVIFVDDPAGLFIDHLLPQPMTGLGIDLVKMRSFRLGRSGIERNRTGHERELKRALPIGTRRHMMISVAVGTLTEPETFSSVRIPY